MTCVIYCVQPTECCVYAVYVRVVQFALSRGQTPGVIDWLHWGVVICLVRGTSCCACTVRRASTLWMSEAHFSMAVTRASTIKLYDGSVIRGNERQSLTASFPGQPGYASTRNIKPIWNLMKQEMMGWQWHQLDHMQITCTSSRQITMPAPHHSIVYRQDALPDVPPTVSKHWRPDPG